MQFQSLTIDSRKVPPQHSNKDMHQQDRLGSQCLHQHRWTEQVVVHKLSAVADEVGTQVRRKADHRKAGLRTIAGVVGDSNPPVLAADLGVGNIAVAADRRSNPCWPCFNRGNR